MATLLINKVQCSVRTVPPEGGRQDAERKQALMRQMLLGKEAGVGYLKQEDL